jgi:hypothetical protein
MELAVHSADDNTGKSIDRTAMTATETAGELLVEAESFATKGGWVLDQQFMDEMGSPFLLAHGLGRPVENAVTDVTFPGTGTYRVWVRTRDWVAPWKGDDVPETKRAEGTPGRFKVLVNGKELATEFGTEGAEWHWQDGGTVEVDATEVTLALHDLTGFEGRCEAIYFTTDAGVTPPDTLEAMEPFRCRLLGLPATPTDAGQYDLVVAGGGIGGMCAALSGARNGLEVAFIQDRPVLGGNNSSEVRVWLGGETNGEKFPRIGDIVNELEPADHAHYGPGNTADLYEDDKRLALFRAEDRLSLFVGHRANAVETSAGRITAVVAQNIETGERLRFGARWVADCTGDGCVGFLAGADYEMTVPGHMGRCNNWHPTDTGKPQTFPRCPWALDLADKPFPGRDEASGPDAEEALRSLGCWYWESGFDHDPIAKREYIRDWNFRAMYGAWDALKNVDNAYATYELHWAAYVSGPRESRRLLGPVVLTREDVLAARAFEDACIMTGWHIDLHYPDKKYEAGFEGDAFISYADFEKYDVPYWMPYRILYSRNVDNLFMAGRDVSVTHEALGTVRVMRTGGLMGEIIGIAAAVCKAHDADPNDVYEQHLDEFKALLARGVPAE